MTYRELLKLYKEGQLDEETKKILNVRMRSVSIFTKKERFQAWKIWNRRKRMFFREQIKNRK